MARIPSTSLPSWVSGLLIGYFIPEEVDVRTKISLGTYGGNYKGYTGTSQQGVHNYPGLFPDYSVQVNIEVLTTGASYNALLLKAVGFYGLIVRVFDYNQKHFNDWSYPIERRNFGYMSISIGENVIHAEPIHFNKVIAQSLEVTTRTMAAMQSHDPNSLTVAAELCCANRYEYTLYKPASIEFKILPVLEVWELSWFVKDSSEEPNEGNCWFGDCDKLGGKYGGTPPLPGDPCRDYWYSCFSE